MTIAKLLILPLAGLAAAVAAQPAPVSVVAIPPFTIRTNEKTSAGETASLGMQAAQLIASDLRASGDLVPVGPDVKTVYSYPEVNAPNFRQWRATGAKALVTGFVTARPDGRIAVGCYVYDLASGQELGRQGYLVGASEWRRAAHRCSDTVYEKLTGKPGWFDTRIAYVSESGAPANLVKRIAVMDGDGTDHRFLTAGEATVLSPAMSPQGDRVAYVSFVGGLPRVRIAAADGSGQRNLVAEDSASFSPVFSPDGRRIAFSLTRNRNTDIYIADADSGVPIRLTSTPGIDTHPSFSPDGRQIAFESDRSGSQQIYVMNADGTDQRRVSFGFGRYAAPAWSPDGERLAFTRIAADGMRIGVMAITGRDEKLLTTGGLDESPSWAASSRHILYQQLQPAIGRSALRVVGIEGGEPRAILTPQGASDPDWTVSAR